MERRRRLGLAGGQERIWLGVLALGMLSAPLGCNVLAQETAKPAAAAEAGAAAPGAAVWSYDVVAISPHDPNDQRMMWRTNDDSVTMSGIALSMLIRNAYGIEQGEEVTGIPGKLDNERFDLRARVSPESMAAMKKLTPEDRAKARQAMMLAMLEDRFKLKAHVVEKEGPVYDLVVAKGGLKAVKAEPDPPGETPSGPPAPGSKPRNGSMMWSDDTMEATGIELKSLAQMLENQVGRKVIDKTELPGKYTFSLKWATEGDQAAGKTGPSIYTALEEQVGLKLESARGPLRNVVVDHLQEPTGN